MTYYTYKGHIYETCGKVRMKDSVKGWVDAIKYHRADNPVEKDKQQTFIREEADFNEKFLPIEFENASVSIFSQQIRTL